MTHKFCISQHQEGITLNPREFALDKPDGDVLLFDSKELAIKYLGVHWPDMPDDPDELDDYGVYVEHYLEDYRCPNCGSHWENTHWVSEESDCYEREGDVDCTMCNHAWNDNDLKLENRPMNDI